MWICIICVYMLLRHKFMPEGCLHMYACVYVYTARVCIRSYYSNVQRYSCFRLSACLVSSRGEKMCAVCLSDTLAVSGAACVKNICMHIDCIIKYALMCMWVYIRKQILFSTFSCEIKKYCIPDFFSRGSEEPNVDFWVCVCVCVCVWSLFTLWKLCSCLIAVFKLCSSQSNTKTLPADFKFGLDVRLQGYYVTHARAHVPSPNFGNFRGSILAHLATACGSANEVTVLTRRQPSDFAGKKSKKIIKYFLFIRHKNLVYVASRLGPRASLRSCPWHLELALQWLSRALRCTNRPTRISYE